MEIHLLPSVQDGAWTALKQVSELYTYPEQGQI